VSDAMIDIQGVGKHFQQRKGSANVVLEGVDLQVRPGEFVSVVGRSGCGKTTLLRMIAGLAPYSPGTIRVRGAVVRGVPPRVGFVFQHAALLPWKTVRQNVELGLNEVRRELSKQQRREMVSRQLELTNLSAAADYLPRELSGGMQQRAGLARALVAEPDVLLMDEPFGAVDALTRLRLQEELAVIVQRTSATVVFVTHDVEEAIFLADRVAVMSIGPGRIRETVEVERPRPRERQADPETTRYFAELRDHVLSLVLEQDGAKGRPQAEAVPS
jgi:ABC-type nitrate/sulfonate/bicarbonate transport system ATPase subunit